MSHLKTSGAHNPTLNDISSFEKAVMLNIKQSIQKHLSHMNIEQQQLNSSLFLSISNYRTDQHTDQCFLMLLRHKANPNCEINETTPLIAACQKGHLSLVKLLLEYGAKPDIHNLKNQTPLQIVLFDRRQNYDIAQALINALPTVNSEIKGKMPIIISVEREKFRIFVMLIQKGASLIFQTENILHIILKKKFKKQITKKKFIKELSGRYFLISEDEANKLPFQYEEDEEIKNFCQEIFKPKAPKPEIITPSKQKVEKNRETHKIATTPKQTDVLPKQKQLSKRKSKEQLDVSFSELDQDEINQDKVHIAQQQKLQQVIQSLDEEDKPQQYHQKQKFQSQKQVLQSSGEILSNSINGQQKSLQKVFIQVQQKEILKNSICDNRILKNPSEINEYCSYRQETMNKKQYYNKTQVQAPKKKPQKYQKPKKKVSFPQEKTNKKKQSIIFDHSMNTSTQQKQKKKQNKNFNDKQIITKEEKDIDKQYTWFQQKKQMQQQSDSQVSQECLLVDLNKQIMEFAAKIDDYNKKSLVFIEQTLALLKKTIKNQIENKLQLKIQLDLIIYGSQSTGLAIENSDVDLLICSDIDSTFLMKSLQQYKILDSPDIFCVKYIYSASMPVIKLKMNEKFKYLKVDMTFQMKNHTGIRCSQIVKEFLSSMPILKHLVIFIKSLVAQYDLNDPYTGGIGSYSIILMVIALLQCTQRQKNQNELANLLLQFFYFYGQQLDYISQAVIVYPPDYHQYPVYSIYQLPLSSAPTSSSNLVPKLIIYDPLNPVNNVSRSSYRISQIKKLFCICYTRLKMGTHLEELLDGSFKQVVHEIDIQK